MQSVDFFQAAGCAWSAVSVLNLDSLSIGKDAQKLACSITPAEKNIGESAPKGPTCDGRKEGWICSYNVKNTALKCKDDQVVDGAYCVPSNTTCKKAALDDWTATVTDDKTVLCE